MCPQHYTSNYELVRTSVHNVIQVATSRLEQGVKSYETTWIIFYDAFILKILKYNEKAKIVSSEQLTLILGERFVLTLQEQPGDTPRPVFSRFVMLSVYCCMSKNLLKNTIPRNGLFLGSRAD